jgi:serine/threonine protein kinase
MEFGVAYYGEQFQTACAYRGPHHVLASGQAEVFRAYNKHGQPVFAKVTKDNHAARRSAIAEKENLELLHSKRVTSSPCKVDVEGDDQEAGRLILVLPMLEGENLHQFLSKQKNRQQNLAFVTKLMLQISPNLADIHEAGVLHGDLHPGNLFLSLNHNNALGFKATIVDFGLSLALPESGTVRLHTRVGIAEYASPQTVQRTGSSIDVKYAPAVDIFSIGLILFQLLTGNKAARFAAVSPQDAFDRAEQEWGNRDACNAFGDRIKAELAETRATYAGSAQQAAVFDELAEVVLRCLRFEPSERPSAKELHQLAWQLEDNYFNRA